jgi:hypothetical protein
LECCGLETSYSYGHISQVGGGFDVDGDRGLRLEEREKVMGRVCWENVLDEWEDFVLSGLYRFESSKTAKPTVKSTYQLKHQPRTLSVHAPTSPECGCGIVPLWKSD